MIPKMKFSIQAAAFTQEYLERLVSMSDKARLVQSDIPPLDKLSKYLDQIKSKVKKNGKYEIAGKGVAKISHAIDDLSAHLEENEDSAKLEELESGMKKACSAIRQRIYREKNEIKEREDKVVRVSVFEATREELNEILSEDPDLHAMEEAICFVVDFYHEHS